MLSFQSLYSRMKIFYVIDVFVSIAILLAFQNQILLLYQKFAEVSEDFFTLV